MKNNEVILTDELQMKKNMLGKMQTFAFLVVSYWQFSQRVSCCTQSKFLWVLFLKNKEMLKIEQKQFYNFIYGLILVFLTHFCGKMCTVFTVG